MRIISLLPLLCLMACSPFPELDQRIDRADQDAAFPQLVPLDTLLAEIPITGAATAGPSSDRIARLRARAARLRGAVIDPATRARMTRGVSHPF